MEPGNYRLRQAYNAKRRQSIKVKKLLKEFVNTYEFREHTIRQIKHAFRTKSIPPGEELYYSHLLLQLQAEALADEQSGLLPHNVIKRSTVYKNHHQL